jgi:nicotinamidase/pyrazinamidase
VAKDAALLIVDLQNDFCPGGALPVPDGHRVVEPLNCVAEHFAAAGLPVLASRDWHPPVTRHFREHGGLWPPHCVQGSAGAAFHPDLRLPDVTIVITKGTDPEQDGYSAFEAVTEDGRTLQEYLAAAGVRHLYIGGLATDYCVRYSALDALRLGFAVTVLTEGVAGVDATPGDSVRALEEMKQAGVTFSTVEELLTLDK